ncbi:MAG: tetratricopeptide repeat protein [Caldilineaceae bacterium]|nr:tetratricopeptide repeat protein [Caldilineaceae bacterium]
MAGVRITVIGAENLANPHLKRFRHFLARSIAVAQQRIQAEGNDAPISPEARERAQNVLSYALQETEAWSETRELLLTMAPKMEMAGYRNEWLQYLMEGLSKSYQQGDQQAEAELQFQCGYLYRLMNRYEQAQVLLLASAEHYASLGETINQARSLNQLAYLAWQQHQYSKVETWAQQALALLDETTLERAMSLSALGLAAAEQARWSESERYHRDALQIRTKHDNQRLMAWSQQNLGYALSGQGQYAEATAYYELAIAKLTKLNDPAHCAIVQMNLGIVYWFEGKTEKAAEIYSAAESTFRHISDDLNLAKVLTCKGLNFHTLQQWSQAESAFLASSRLFHKLGDYSEYLNALDGLGISYLEQERYSKALVIFESIRLHLPEVAGTRSYRPLSEAVPRQLEQAKLGRDNTSIVTY